MLITGEYAVLDGADALAIPTKKGQRMNVKRYNGSDLVWHSYDVNGDKWFSAIISLYDFSALKTTDQDKSNLLQKLLKNAVRLNPEFLDKWNGYKVETHLEFPNNWGLGSSSTLIYMIASWADVHPLELYFKSFGGSGYDVACAGSEVPIIYYNDEDEIGYTPVQFEPKFSDHLYFVHLGHKKDSQIAIKEYLKEAKGRKTLAKKITTITNAVLEVQDLLDFATLMDEHEDLISAALGKEKVKNLHFSDFWGSIKSLGAWGGDFVMALSDQDAPKTITYFQQKGYKTILTYDEMVLPLTKALVEVKEK